MGVLIGERFRRRSVSLSVRARVCRHLLRLAGEPQALDMTQEEFAEPVGVARGTLRRCLAELEAVGAIDTSYRKLRVLEIAVLQRFRNEQ